MTNAQILVNSLNEWVTPIIEKAFKGLANQNQFTFMLSNLITPARLTSSIKEHLGMPMIHQYISRLPDEAIPGLALDLIDGMIETRVEKGPLDIPAIGVRLSPDAFKNLKAICEKNFESYSEPAKKEEK